MRGGVSKEDRRASQARDTPSQAPVHLSEDSGTSPGSCLCSDCLEY